MPPLANASVGSDGLHTPWQFGPRSSLLSRVPEPLLPCMLLYIVFSSWLEYILFLPLSVSKFLGPLYPKFLFFSAQVKEALAKCEFMARSRLGPLYMYCPRGSGKTTLVMFLIGEIRLFLTFGEQCLLVVKAVSALFIFNCQIQADACTQ